jgi:uncharacterized protein YceK
MKAGNLLILIVATACSGCGSFYARCYPPPNRVYVGVRQDTEFVFSDGNWGIIVDYPFSAIVDTVLLPVDLWPKSHPKDPLKGWTFREFDALGIPGHQHHPMDKAVIDDYQYFITNNTIATIGAVSGFFENGTGQHAIQFEGSPANKGTYW